VSLGKRKRTRFEVEDMDVDDWISLKVGKTKQVVLLSITQEARPMDRYYKENENHGFGTAEEWEIP
jgi:hypothetical protein